MALPDGGTQAAYNAGRTRTSTDSLAGYWEFYGIPSDSPTANLVRNRIAGGDDPDEAFTYYAGLMGTGPFAPKPELGTGGSVGRTLFPEEKALMQAQTQEIVQGPAERALDRQAEERMNRLRDLNDLIREAMGNQQSAKEMKFAYKNDPFALAGAFSSQGPRGTSPVVAARNELQNYINQPIPTVAPNATLPQINQAITQVPGQVPIAGGFGMAAGGMLPMMPPQMAPQGGQPQMGTTKVATLIGEGPDTVIEPGTEVAVTDKAMGTTEIIPLMGGAATGATLPQLPTAQSSYGALEDLYRPFGFQNIPTYRRPASGSYYFRGVNPSQLSEMGYRPNLVRVEGSSQVYFRDPSGSLRPFRMTKGANTFSGSGFGIGDVQTISAADFAGQGIGSRITSNLPDIGADTGAFGPMTTPMFTTFGQLLPNPSYISQELIDAYNNDPLQWANYVSAYGNAVGPTGSPMGMTEEQLIGLARAPLPAGVPRQVLGFR